MAKIMNRYLISLSIVFMALSFAVAGELHPGLKNAIDNGDYKTAKNLVEKVGVTDVYCPGSLSVKDAEKVYGSILKKNPLAILDGNALSFDFSIKYAEEKCNGTQYDDGKICYQWVMNQKQIKNDLWKRMFDKWFKEGKGLCLNAETMNNCLLYVYSKSDYKDKMEIIRQVEKKKLIKFEGTFEKDTVVKEPIPKDQCLLNLKDFEQMQTLFIGAKQNATETFEFPFGFCSFNGTKQAINTCVKKLHEAVKDAEKKCKNGKMTKDVKKTIKRKGHIFPLEYEMMEIRQNLLAAKWYEMGDEWWENFTLLSKYLDGPKEKDAVDEMKQKYSSKGDFDITELVRNCKIYPNIDKSVKKVFGFEAFSCKQVLNKFILKDAKISGAKCEAKNMSWILKVPLTLNGKDSLSVLVCDAKNEFYRPLSEYESIAQEICENVKSVWMKKEASLVCDSMGWRPASEYEVFAGVCDESKYGVLVYDFPQDTIICDRNEKKWKSAGRERIIGSCTESNQGKKMYGLMCNNLNWEQTNDGGDLVDARDGKKYKTAKIGNYLWMAENIKYEPGEDEYGNLIKTYCYNDSSENCDKYGRLYDYKVAVKVRTSDKTFVQGICPDGWHIPNYEEWNELIKLDGDKQIVQTKKLQSIDDKWMGYDYYRYGGDYESFGYDVYGFSAKPAGYRFEEHYPKYQDVNKKTCFWTSSVNSEHHPVFFCIGTESVFLKDGSVSGKYDESLSVRCVKDYAK